MQMCSNADLHMNAEIYTHLLLEWLGKHSWNKNNHRYAMFWTRDKN